MKYIWQPKDIECGKLVCKANTLQRSVLDGWDAKWVYLIGYSASGPSGRTEDRSRNSYLLIAICDGVTSNAMTRDELLARLNKDEMAPLSTDKLIAVAPRFHR